MDLLFDLAIDLLRVKLQPLSKLVKLSGVALKLLLLFLRLTLLLVFVLKLLELDKLLKAQMLAFMLTVPPLPMLSTLLLNHDIEFQVL